MKVLLDEMYDGLADRLQKDNYEVYTVSKLKKDNAKLGNDFNIISYARDHELVLITNDSENGTACKANNIPCIFVNLQLVLERIVLPDLKKLKIS